MLLDNLFQEPNCQLATLSCFVMFMAVCRSVFSIFRRNKQEYPPQQSGQKGIGIKLRSSFLLKAPRKASFILRVSGVTPSGSFQSK
ncbi:hypothetical protein M5689_017977 [Euphorbia peplus]|nr:hypothetical protein M5689_017977 [Euphorbia peplus]